MIHTLVENVIKPLIQKFNNFIALMLKYKDFLNHLKEFSKQMSKSMA
jgi:hypothetical protein